MPENLKTFDVSGRSYYSTFIGSVKRNWLFILLGILAANAIFLDVLFFTFGKNSTSGNAQNSAIGAITNPFSHSDNSCPQSCVSQINSLISQITPTGAALKSQVAATTPAQTQTTPVATPTTVPNAFREYFIPMGAGSGNPADWAVVPGTGVTLDPADYGNNPTITFEITARVPTGNQTISVRVYNANSFQMVPGTEMTMSGTGPTLLVTKPVTLSAGSNLYQIQMKTQLQYAAYIDQARIRIRATN